jgi:hypothetical protein
MVLVGVRRAAMSAAGSFHGRVKPQACHRATIAPCPRLALRSHPWPHPKEKGHLAAPLNRLVQGREGDQPCG